jgi:hypothetical protein
VNNGPAAAIISPVVPWAIIKMNHPFLSKNRHLQPHTIVDLPVVTGAELLE